MSEEKEENKTKMIARLKLRHKVVDEMEISSIPAKINIPSIGYIEDPTNFNFKVYNLVFVLRNVRSEDEKQVVEYEFAGIEEVRS
jgi:hypothetical protein